MNCVMERGKQETELGKGKFHSFYNVTRGQQCYFTDYIPNVSVCAHAVRVYVRTSRIMRKSMHVKKGKTNLSLSSDGP